MRYVTTLIVGGVAMAFGLAWTFLEFWQHRSDPMWIEVGVLPGVTIVPLSAIPLLFMLL